MTYYQKIEEIIEDDYFISLPVNVQCLYLHLYARANSHGLVLNPKSLTRGLGFSEQDLKQLIEDEYIEYDGRCVEVTAISKGGETYGV